MKCTIVSPITSISKNIASHRSAQAVIYADQLKRSGVDIDICMSGEPLNFDKIDVLYVYHGNDWGGVLNMFGGVDQYKNLHNLIAFSKFKGKVYSLSIDFPNYHDLIQYRLRNEKIEETKWKNLDFDNLKKIQSKAKTINTNDLVLYDKAVIGDSHAISLYRPGWMINSVPFKTLYGALNTGLDKFLPTDKIKFNELEFYFGNIDVRHHLLRQANPEEATRELVRRYFDAVKTFNIESRIYELLPIENESRRLPKSGFYMQTPFYGSRQERNEIRLIFKDECKKQQNDRVRLVEWVTSLINDHGELDFKYMEKPKSIHLSRGFYPHWQGLEWNKIKIGNTLEDFL